MAFAQIETENGQVFWRTVKQYENNSESVLKQLKSSVKFSTLELLDDTISGKFMDTSINYQGIASMYLIASYPVGSLQFHSRKVSIELPPKTYS